ncbi:MAG: CRISPR-associated endoribonuclease Cas6, partial [Bacteroidales bacterium]|nr:CRISPR-associated endoribonuclease Cas6 [Bacteroidales bacterium]
MRLIIKIKPNQLLIPFDHQHLLVGSIHKWLGWNKIHDNISLYSFSRLDGGKAINSGLKFEHGTSFFFSSHETGLIKSIIEGVQRDPFMF